MGDLATDTTVDQTGPSSFSCDLSPDWEIWDPNGGHLAAVAMRAAGVASARATQEGRPLLVATVWGVDGDLDGPEHCRRAARRPDR